MSKRKNNQPLLDLPEIDGQKPKLARTQVNAAGSVLRISEHKGEVVYWLTVGKIKKVAWQDTDAGLEYQVTVRVTDEVKLEGAQGLELVSRIRKGKLEAAGEHALPEFGEAGYVAENGVVLLPSEVAERRGEEPPASVEEDKAAAAFFGQPGEPALGDGVPAFDDWESPDPELPLPADFTTVDVTVDQLREGLRFIADARQLRRLLKAERQRSKSGKGRAAAVAAIERRLADVEAAS